MKQKNQNLPLKILITGGAGFIGSALVRHIINDTNHSVVNIDKLTYAGNLFSIQSVEGNPNYSFERVDICDTSEIKRVFNEHQPNVVMHLAAESHVDRSIDSPGEFMKTNITGTYNLLEQARLYWSNLKGQKKESFCFHHISTDEVYGDLPHPDNQLGELPLFTETTPYAPSSPYSASKASSDHLVRAWRRTYGLPTLITNCSNNYGPFQFPEKLIPLMILNAIKGMPLPIYARGNQIRDWLYVDDHARALVLVATKGKDGETYNIGGLNEKQNIEVVKTICKILQQLAPPVNFSLDISNYESLITFVNDRPGHDMRYAIDSSKIQKELGWMPLETFESGLYKTIQWYLNNESWYKKIKDGTYRQ